MHRFLCRRLAVAAARRLQRTQGLMRCEQRRAAKANLATAARLERAPQLRVAPAAKYEHKEARRRRRHLAAATVGRTRAAAPLTLERPAADEL